MVIMRPSIVCCALSLFCAVAPVRAQRQDASGFHVVAFTTGATVMSVSSINSLLTAANFAGLSTDGISYGLTAHYAFGRALLGVDAGHVTFGEEGLNNGRTDDLNANQLLGTAGYAIYSSKQAIIYPQLGVGIGQFDVTLRDRNGGAKASPSQPTFAEVAQNPGSTTTLSGSHLLFGVGAGADFLVTRGTGDVGVVFGIRGGALLSPNRTTWKADGRDVLAGPDASAQGPFLRVVIGIGGR